MSSRRTIRAATRTTPSLQRGLRQGRRGRRRRAGQGDRAQHPQGHVRVPAAAGAGDEAAVLAPEALLRRAPAVPHPQPRLRVPGAGRTGLLEAIPVVGDHLGLLEFASWIYIAWYLYRGMRNVYQQRRGITVAKYFAVGFFYFCAALTRAAAHGHLQRHDGLERRRACAVSSLTVSCHPHTKEPSMNTSFLPRLALATALLLASASAAVAPIARLRPRAPRSTSCRRRTAPRSRAR